MNLLLKLLFILECYIVLVIDIVKDVDDTGFRLENLVEKDMVVIPINHKIKTHKVASPDYL